MTTVAFDGEVMAADTLVTDYYGLKDICHDKILVGKDFLAGCAGEWGGIQSWWDQVKDMTCAELIAYGYPNYQREHNDPAIMIASKNGIWRHTTSWFYKTPRSYHAVGSGRDYALAAMFCGRGAVRAVECARSFDNGTGGEIVQYRIPA